jgi:hypothetical protein
MALILCLLLQQAPVLVPVETRELLEMPWRGLALSRTGKYLVLGDAKWLHILDSKSLATVKQLEVQWTAFAFDEKDQHLLVVGSDVARFAARDWSLQFQAPLPETEKGPLPVPGKALVLPDLDFYYCTKEGGLALGSVGDRKLTVKPMNLKSEFGISRILGLVENQPVLGLEKNVKAGIIARGQVHFLPGSQYPLFAGEVGTLAVVIGLEEEALYSPRSWKVMAARSGEKNSCAAVDGASGWVFVGGPSGLRAWHLTRFQEPVRLDAFKEGVVQLALDGRQRMLFSAEKAAVRRWKISD